MDKQYIPLWEAPSDDVAGKSLKAIVEEILIPALRKQAADADEFHDRYVPEEGTGPCEANTEGHELIHPAGDGVTRALVAYGRAYFHRTGFGPSFDVPDPDADIPGIDDVE